MPDAFTTLAGVDATLLVAFAVMLQPRISGRRLSLTQRLDLVTLIALYVGLAASLLGVLLLALGSSPGPQESSLKVLLVVAAFGSTIGLGAMVGISWGKASVPPVRPVEKSPTDESPDSAATSDGAGAQERSSED